MEHFHFGIGLLYGLNGIISLIAFIPTFIDLIIYKKPSANVQSYIIWSYTGFIGLLYAYFVIHDLKMIIVSGIGFTCSFIVLILSLVLKK